MLRLATPSLTPCKPPLNLVLGARAMTNQNTNTVTLYRPAGPEEMRLVEQSDFSRWPPRLPGQPIFYPVTNEEYAVQITRQWNGADYGEGYVTRFEVATSFMDNYPIQKVGSGIHTEWWIPAEDLEEMNDNIVGKIEVIGHYKASDSD